MLTRRVRRTSPPVCLPDGAGVCGAAAPAAKAGALGSLGVLRCCALPGPARRRAPAHGPVPPCRRAGAVTCTHMHAAPGTCQSGNGGAVHMIFCACRGRPHVHKLSIGKYKHNSYSRPRRRRCMPVPCASSSVLRSAPLRPRSSVPDPRSPPRLRRSLRGCRIPSADAHPHVIPLFRTMPGTCLHRRSTHYASLPGEK